MWSLVRKLNFFSDYMLYITTSTTLELVFIVVNVFFLTHNYPHGIASSTGTVLVVTPSYTNDLDFNLFTIPNIIFSRVAVEPK